MSKSSFIYENYNIFGFKSYIINNIPDEFDIFVNGFDFRIIKSPNLMPISVLQKTGLLGKYEYVIYDPRNKNICKMKDILKDYIVMNKIISNKVNYFDEESVLYYFNKYNVIKYLNKLHKTKFDIRKIDKCFTLKNLVLRPNLVYNILLGMDALNIKNIDCICEFGNVFNNIIDINEYNLKEKEIFTCLYFDKKISNIQPIIETYFRLLNIDIDKLHIDDIYLEPCEISKIVYKLQGTDVILGNIIDRGIYDFKVLNSNIIFDKKLSNPIIIKSTKIKPNTKKIYLKYPLISKDIITYIKNNKDNKNIFNFEKNINYISVNNKLITLTNDMFIFNEIEEKIESEKYTPHITEISIMIDSVNAIKKLIS